MEPGDERYFPPDRPARRAGQEPSARLTLDAYVRLRKELERLETDGRSHIAERLLHARELGDISENAEYESAKHEQALMEGRIRELQHRLKIRRSSRRPAGTRPSRARSSRSVRSTRTTRRTRRTCSRTLRRSARRAPGR